MNDAAVIHEKYQAQLDTEALKIAVRVEAKQDEHERICAERWGEARGLMKKTLWTVLATMATVIGYLANLLITGTHH